MHGTVFNSLKHLYCWLQSNMADALSDINGFTLVCADRNTNSRKCKGGGTCVSTKQSQCPQFIVRYCCHICGDALHDSRTVLFTVEVWMHPVVCVLPSGKAAEVATAITECVHKLEQKHNDAPAVLLGDFNHWNLDGKLAGFCQYVKNRQGGRIS